MSKERVSDQASEMKCKKCGQRPRSRTLLPNGWIQTDLYCGGSDCTALPSVTEFPISSIPTPAAAGNSDSNSIRPEDLKDPVTKTISVNMKNRWSSDDIELRKLKGICRLDLPGKIYRRFDTALQMNEGCTIITTYYGGRETCGISKDSITRAHPCVLESCTLCTAIRSAFGNFLYGSSSHDGTYGPGVYTYVNPASAHQALASNLQGKAKNYTIIQCRVVIQGKEKKAANPYAASFVNESGTAFCAQPVAIIPTHLLIYSVIGKKQDAITEPTAKELDLNNTGKIDGTVSNHYRERTSGKLPNRHANPDSRLDEDDSFHPRSVEDLDDDDDLPDLVPSLPPQPGATVETLHFYDQTHDSYELSNYAPYLVTYEGKKYPTAEHLFQAIKASIRGLDRTW
ncbi:hypothetical protein M407DRAFT_33016 [Tulasnella calospora MUT 4182]|uniref:PARP catalytic domain-containing protein n=1 Tax=Tulasnella calospora MUT 4182 TaxID=1051891 RepID=A0A0C3Q331_9AGAM|nr:hypothetical protein M407DRAFT_33016 [Tulasnella calospora MUT 4182]